MQLHFAGIEGRPNHPLRAIRAMFDEAEEHVRAFDKLSKRQGDNTYVFGLT
jgi:hypothetical protein